VKWYLWFCLDWLTFFPKKNRYDGRPYDTPGIISVDDIDLEYLNTKVHLDDVSEKPDCGRPYFLPVEIEDFAEEEGGFNKLDGLLLRQISSEKFIRLGKFRMWVVKFRNYSIL
jgi:hypothetical protein